MPQTKQATNSTKTNGRNAKPTKPRKGKSLPASAESSKRRPASMEDVLEFYKPIKKPVTLRLDADVIAWYKSGGRRYQTRINAALRKLMEREMKATQ
jgi:uncharacterized protein (DUF4415 family)